MKTEQLRLPTDLGHQPLRAVPYVAHDGKWAGDTDAQYLSVGRAQWGQQDLSAKVFRHVDTRWSRQSEELPVHRAIDLVTFTALALLGESDEVPADTFENQPDPLKMQPPPALPLVAVEPDFADDIDLARTRLQKLRDVLNDLHQKGLL
jgi:hypothetical protein